MGVNKLDIEFEDDEEIQAREEAERKKNEVLENVDLEFGNEPEGSGASLDEAKQARRAARDKAQQQPQQQPRQQQQQQQPRQQQQQQQQQQQAQPQQRQQVAPAQQTAPVQQQVYIGPEYRLGDELKKSIATNQVLAIEIEARVKIEVTEKLTETIARHHADTKLLEHKVNKILTQINQKVPALKNELMMIKKLLREHATIGEEEATEPKPQAQQQPRPVKKKAA
ncbi:MAG: hypothetical protein K9K67_12580 [Bacteriovoracaceae bacterium]|nr:hypothetical protein [Bacteriovoracaceae bacterium]